MGKRRGLWGLVLLLVAACGGGDGGGPGDAATRPETGAADTAPQADAPLDPGQPDSAPPVFTAMAGAPVEGTYRHQDTSGLLTLTLTEGRLFVRRAAFGCNEPGDPPCVFDRAIPDISCATSYQKGYTALLADNHALAAVKEDQVEAWVTGSDAIQGFYRLRPGFCCQADRVFHATFVDAAVCTDYETPDCDPVAATGCPDQQHCVWDDKNLPVCAGDGAAEVGAVCEGGFVSCRQGTCMDLGEAGARCYRYCHTGADCAGLPCLELTGKPWKVCGLPASAFEACDLLAPACQAGGDGCYVTGITTAPICIQAGAKTEGQVCAKPNDCAPGLHCHNDDLCRPLCGVGGVPACADAFDTCRLIYGGVGVCSE